MARGKWPVPCALHECDNRPCCNPAHLFEGTRLENDMDRDAKGRTARGEGHGRRKLTDESVRAIRAALGVSKAELARLHGVSHKTVRNVLSGRIWTHVVP